MFGQGNGSILETINCRGSELRVADCSISDRVDSSSCTHAEDAGVRCCKLVHDIYIHYNSLTKDNQLWLVSPFLGLF